MSINKNIRNYRRTHEMTIDEFATQLGVSHQTIINWEKGHVSSYDRIINKISDVFPDFKSWGKPTKKQPATEGSAMFETTDGYYVSRDPNTGRLTRMKKDDTDVVEVRINGEWVPDQAP